MWLRSDNAAGVDSSILAAMTACNEGDAASYGEDALSRTLDERFAEIFGAPAKVFPVPSGTAGNALALASLADSFDAILCHEKAHAFDNESGATEAYTGGARFLPVGGEHGRIDAEYLIEALDIATGAGTSSHAPRVLTVTQLTEAGTVYSIAQLQELGTITRQRGLYFHMDGARFANAVATLGVTPADITWKVGVDVLSFGATKNGTMYADAVVFFDHSRAQRFKQRLKRGGHALSKTRYLAAQLLSYIDGDRWLANARHANLVASQLAAVIQRVPNADLVHPVEGNIIFAAFDDTTVRRFSEGGLALRSKGRTADGREMFRLVTSFATPAAESARLATILGC